MSCDVLWQWCALFKFLSVCLGGLKKVKRLGGQLEVSTMSNIQKMDVTSDHAGSTDFQISAVKVGRSRMRGWSTAGHMVSGVVQAVLPGMAFRVDTGAQISYLWRELVLLDEEASAAEAEAEADAMEIDGPPPSTPIRRTDSGADYGMNGFPDCEFWESRDVVPLFLATPADYAGDTPLTPQQMIHELNACRKTAEALGGANWRAWKRQMTIAMEKTIQTPPRSPTPDAPPRVRRVTLTHRGGGILEGDFIKPDPALTRSETRAYLMAETDRWLNGRIQRHALGIYASQLAPADIEQEVRVGLWPAGRLYMLLMRLRDMEAVPDTDIDEQITHVVRWVAHTIQACVDRKEPLSDLEELAMGFWQKDLLPNGRTIASYWNHSPFEALRSAGAIGFGMDERLDTLVTEFLMEDHTFTLPGWALVAVTSVGVWYMWCVAAALSMKCQD